MSRWSSPRASGCARVPRIERVQQALADLQDITPNAVEVHVRHCVRKSAMRPESRGPRPPTGRSEERVSSSISRQLVRAEICHGGGLVRSTAALLQQRRTQRHRPRPAPARGVHVALMARIEVNDGRKHCRRWSRRVPRPIALTVRDAQGRLLLGSAHLPAVSLLTRAISCSHSPSLTIATCAR